VKTRKFWLEAEMANRTGRQDLPEKTRYTRYYEHDGMLRAYANRSMLLAMVFAVIALSSFAFAVYVRLQPPTVIRVDSEGEATIIAGTPGPGRSRGLNFVASAAESAPTEVEAKAVVRRFLDRYLDYTPATVDRQIADALNMMTGNFKALVLSRLREDDTLNKIQDDHIVTNFIIRTITVVQGSPLTFTAFGVKEIHRLKNKQETTDLIVGRYNVRLALDRRTEYNPSGLLVADYWEQQMVGDKNTGLSQPDELSREATDKNR
jgi:type IV secretory pathway TrbF-like protein